MKNIYEDCEFNIISRALQPEEKEDLHRMHLFQKIIYNSVAFVVVTVVIFTLLLAFPVIFFLLMQLIYDR